MKAFARLSTMSATRTQPSKQPTPPRLRNASNRRGPAQPETPPRRPSKHLQPSTPPPKRRRTNITIEEKESTPSSPQHQSPVHIMPPTSPSPSRHGSEAVKPAATQPATTAGNSQPQRRPAPASDGQTRPATVGHGRPAAATTHQLTGLPGTHAGRNTTPPGPRTMSSPTDRSTTHQGHAALPPPQLAKIQRRWRPPAPLPADQPPP